MNERYQIKSRIGIGGHGVIFEAFDTQMRRNVAIKRISSVEGAATEGRKSFERETQTLAALNHPNIVKVYDADEDEEGFYLVMELVKGRTLMEFVDENNPVAQEDFFEFVVQALDALSAAKQVSILHRDIKPTNFLVERTHAGRLHITLLDFCLAKVAEKSDLQTRSVDDTVMGSVHFMAPEQFEMLPLDHRTDLYSLGVCCYYMLSSSYPFEGNTAPLIMASHLQHRFIPLHERRPDLPKGLVEWVHHMIAREPKDRPADPMQALKSLRALGLFEISAETPVVESKEEKPPQPAPVSESKGKGRVLMTALGTAALLGGGVLLAVNAPWMGQKEPTADVIPTARSSVQVDWTKVQAALEGKPADQQIELPGLETWSQEITEPGALIELEPEASHPETAGQVVAIRMEDGVGAQGFPRLSWKLPEVVAHRMMVWTLDFRVTRSEEPVEEHWKAVLSTGATDQHMEMVSLNIGQDHLTISGLPVNQRLSLQGDQWYRITVGLDPRKGKHQGWLECLSSKEEARQAWSGGLLESAPNETLEMALMDGSENSFQPNPKIHFANPKIRLRP